MWDIKIADGIACFIKRPSGSFTFQQANKLFKEYMSLGLKIIGSVVC